MKDQAFSVEKRLQLNNITTLNSYKYYVAWLLLAFKLARSCMPLPFCNEIGLDYKTLTLFRNGRAVYEKSLNCSQHEFSDMNSPHLAPDGFRGLWS